MTKRKRGPKGIARSLIVRAVGDHLPDEETTSSKRAEIADLLARDFGLWPEDSPPPRSTASTMRANRTKAPLPIPRKSAEN